MKRFVYSHVRLFSLLSCLLLVPAAALAGDDEGSGIDIGYHALKPSIVSNLTGGPKYIRCDVQLMTQRAAKLPQIELHTAALRHALLMLISGKDGPELLTSEGKEQLRKDALAAVRDQLEDLTGDPIVKDLYFTNYYVK